MRTYYIFLTGFLLIGFWLNCAANKFMHADGMSASASTSAASSSYLYTPKPTVEVDTSAFEILPASRKHAYVSQVEWRSILYRYGKDLEQAKQILDTVVTLNETTYHLIQTCGDSIR